MVKSQESTSKSFRIGILTASIFVAAFAGSLFYMNTLGVSAPPEFVNMRETSRINFKAHLTDSEPFGRSYLDRTSDNIPLNLLDHIEINHNYAAELSIETFVEFTHSATVTLTARRHRGTLDNENSPVILNRTFPLCFNNKNNSSPETCDNAINVKPAKITGDRYDYSETYLIYLKPYLDFVKSTTESFVEYPIRASITVDFQTFADNGGQLRGNFKRSLTIPLTDEDFNINITGDESRKVDYYAPKRTAKDYILLAVYGVSVIGGALVAIIIAKKLLNHKTWYRQEIDKYLRDYDDAIIDTATPLDLNTCKERIAIKDFKELLNFATVTDNPIMYYENREAAFFYCLRDEFIYFFVIRKTKKNPRV